MEKLKGLKISRTHIIKVLERFEAYLDSNPNPNLDELRERLRKIEESWTRFEEIQTSIETIQQDEKGVDVVLLEEVEKRVEFENKYFKETAKAKQILGLVVPTLQAVHLNPKNQAGVNPTTNRSKVKLPVLNLPNFNGDYDQWLLFKDAFTSSIREDDTLTPIQKFQYLRSSLKGDAAQVIQSLNTSAENYQIGWDLLVQRYENKRLIINTHLKRLLDFSQVSKGDHTSLRTFIDHILTHTRALKSLDEPVDQYSTMLIHLALNKLDFETRCDWEYKQEGEDMPTLDGLMEFLTNRSRKLELVAKQNTKQESGKAMQTRLSTEKNMQRRVSLATTTARTCNYCGKNHLIFECDEFLKLPVETRIQEVKKRQLCLNCFRCGHFSADCRSSSCKTFNKRYNTLLHRETRSTSLPDNKQEEASSVVSTCIQTLYSQENKDQNDQNNFDASISAHFSGTTSSQVVLSTAIIYVIDSKGNKQTCRALLDMGSQPNLITSNLLRRLQLNCKRTEASLRAVQLITSATHQTTHVNIKSRLNNYSATMECLVTQNITQRLPQEGIAGNLFKIPDHVFLADPKFDQPSEIDLLIRAQYFWQLLSTGKINLYRNIFFLHNTELGWIFEGELGKGVKKSTPRVCHLITKDILRKQVERFWQEEEFIRPVPISEKEQECEKQFTKTVGRNSDGRFIVGIPKYEEIKLGSSKNEAIKKLLYLERRLNKHSEMKQQYHDFLKEYEHLGHMSITDDKDNSEEEKEFETYYIPHQPTVRMLRTMVGFNLFAGGCQTVSQEGS